MTRLDFVASHIKILKQAIWELPRRPEYRRGYLDAMEAVELFIAVQKDLEKKELLPKK